VKGKKIVLWDAECRDILHRYIDGLDLSKPWQAVLKPFYESPSDRQRGYYREVMLPAIAKHVEDSGQGTFTHDQVHEWLKTKFGEHARVEIDGEAYEVCAFTTSGKGDIATMSTYITRILRWAAGELGLYIPPPREKWGRKAA